MILSPKIPIYDLIGWSLSYLTFQFKLLLSIILQSAFLQSLEPTPEPEELAVVKQRFDTFEKEMNLTEGKGNYFNLLHGFTLIHVVSLFQSQIHCIFVSRYFPFMFSFALQTELPLACLDCLCCVVRSFFVLHAFIIILSGFMLMLLFWGFESHFGKCETERFSTHQIDFRHSFSFWRADQGCHIVEFLWFCRVFAAVETGLDSLLGGSWTYQTSLTNCSGTAVFLYRL